MELILKKDEQISIPITLLMIHVINTSGLEKSKTNINILINKVMEHRFDKIHQEIKNDWYWKLRAFEELKTGTVFQALIYLLHSLCVTNGATRTKEETRA